MNTAIFECDTLVKNLDPQSDSVFYIYNETGSMMIDILQSNDSTFIRMLKTVNSSGSHSISHILGKGYYAHYVGELLDSTKKVKYFTFGFGVCSKQ